MLKFGTDGIRGIVEDSLDTQTIFKLGYALGKKVKNCRILLAKDNRVSSDFVSSIFCSGLLSQGAIITDIGNMSTPSVSYLLKTIDSDYGVMISASHNPPEYNGIKIFHKSGRKLFDEEEKELEELMQIEYVKTSKYGKYFFMPHLKHNYFRYLEKIGLNFVNNKILVDLSNGVTSFYAKDILTATNNNIVLINNSVDGRKINENAGILNSELLKHKKIEANCDYAIAVDGDGDRVCIVDRYNNILDGDIMLYILANYYKNYKKIKCVVGTTQTNLGIEKSLNSLGINLIRSDVGDKNLIKEMLKNNSQLGAEQSGHIIIKDYLSSGDGLLCAMVVLNIIKSYEKNNTYVSLLSQIKTVPQINLNYEYKNKDLLENLEVKNYLDQKSKFMGKDYRMVVRKSGSESKIRIMVEGINFANAQNMAKEILEFLEKNDVD